MALVAGGGALAVTASADEANPNSWHLLDQQASELGAALLLLGVVGEAFITMIPTICGRSRSPAMLRCKVAPP